MIRKFLISTFISTLSFSSFAFTDEELRQLFIVSQNYDPGKPAYGGIVLYKGYFDKMHNACNLKKAFPDTLLFTDQEGGEVTRINENAPPPPYKSKNYSLDKFSDLIDKSAKTLKKRCVDVNLAPSIEISTDKRNYGNDEKTVVLYSTVFIEQMRKNGILTINKHFPPRSGHTCINATHLDELNIKINSNNEAARCNMFSSELFEASIQTFMQIPADGMMVNASLYPKFGNYPAFMNKRVKNYIREDLKYDKLVISDAIWGLDLKSIDVLKVLKTVDMVMVGNSYQVEFVLPLLKEAIQKNAFTQEEIKEKLNRIEKFKAGLKKAN